jgi:hypothetical protein
MASSVSRDPSTPFYRGPPFLEAAKYMACVSDVSPYDPFRPRSPLGWFVKRFPAQRHNWTYLAVIRPILLQGFDAPFVAGAKQRYWNPVDKSLINSQWGTPSHKNGS